MTGETVGQALKRWRQERRLSLRALADHINYSHVYVWEIEKDVKAGRPEIIAACDEFLQTGGQLIGLAARARHAAAGEPDVSLGLQVASSWTESLDTVSTLWRHDAGRRKLLRGAVFVPAALTLPMQHWLEIGEHQDTGGPRIDMDEASSADAVRAMTATFRRLDNLYGGADVRPAVVQYLDAEVGPVLRGNTPDRLGADFLSAAAEMTQL